MKSGDEIWDTDVPGLHIRALKSGKYFYLYYRNCQGDQRKPSLGRYGAITLVDARNKAREFLGEISNGGDPSLTRREEKIAVQPTMFDLKERWEKEHAIRLKSKNDLVRLWDIYIIPILGKEKVYDLTKQDLIRVLYPLKSNYTHNRVRSLLSKALNLAEDWGWRDDFTNPTRKIKKRPEQYRTRYLQPSEINRLGKILGSWLSSTRECEYEFACLIKLLLFTGARRNEIMKAKWSYIDWHRGIIVLPDSKTGPKEIVLAKSAIHLLEHMYKSRNNEWIIPGRHENKPLSGPSRLWKRLCAEAEIENLRIHDLRHSFASTALSSIGGNLAQVGSLLGHTRQETTARYAHFMTSPKRQLADKTASVIESWLAGEKE